MGKADSKLRTASPPVRTLFYVYIVIWSAVKMGKKIHYYRFKIIHSLGFLYLGTIQGISVVSISLTTQPHCKAYFEVPKLQFCATTIRKLVTALTLRCMSNWILHSLISGSKMTHVKIIVKIRHTVSANHLVRCTYTSFVISCVFSPFLAFSSIICCDTSTSGVQQPFFSCRLSWPW